MSPSTRREFLMGTVMAGVLPAEAAQRRRRRRLRPLPRVNGGINVHPVRRMDGVSDFSEPLIVPDLVLAQMRAVYELGFRSLRISLSFNEFGPDFFAAIPYVRMARALGIDVIGIVVQFGFGYDLLRALSDPARRWRVLEAYRQVFGADVATVSPHVEAPGSITFQILNEPTQWYGISGTDYVRRFLFPVYTDLKRLDPELRVISAATVGRRAGLLRLKDMLVAGLEHACDAVGVHVYDASLLPHLQGLMRLPVVVTESGVIGTDRHLDWILDMHPRIRQYLPAAEEIYHYVLYEGQPGVFQILDLQESEPGQIRVDIESGALAVHLGAQIPSATGRRPYARFEDLVPDLAPYLPNSEDFAAAAWAR